MKDKESTNELDRCLLNQEPSSQSSHISVLIYKDHETEFGFGTVDILSAAKNTMIENGRSKNASFHVHA